MTELCDRKHPRDDTIQAPHLMIRAPKDQNQECQVWEKFGLE